MEKMDDRIEIIDLADFDFTAQVESLGSVNRSDDLCCIIFTSGSTGIPKGAGLTHGNISNYAYYAENFLFNEAKQIISATIMTFDAFIQETIIALCDGKEVVLLDEKQCMNPTELWKAVSNYHNSFLFMTPTKWLEYMRIGNIQSYDDIIKNFIAGGENFTDELHQYMKKINPNGNIFNIYGPTETTIAAVIKVIDDGDITIGRPIANTQIYILDEAQHLLPAGVPGELCIAGEGVGKGYLNQPELTAERFVPNPFATENNHHGKIMYRTGDLARWREDGEIEYLGRIDTQVKIRGLRIELGEIESVTASFPGVGLAAAAAQKDENGRQYLVGYYTATENIDEKELRAHLAAKLPKYMVPNYFVRLDEMPMTPSGKTDRKNLPLPDFTTKKNDDYVAPETGTEQRLAEIWQNLLRVDRVGRNDDFFDLGGDSLFAIAMGSEIEKCFGISLSMENILRHSSLEQMAAQIGEAEKGGAAYPHLQSGDATRYHLLPQQEAIYAACTKDPASMVYNLPARLSLSTDIDRKKLKEAIHRVIKRYKALNCAIIPSEGGIFAVYNASAEPVFEEYEKSDEHTFFRAFDLTKPPLVHIGFTEDSLLLDAHHIAADGATLRILLREIADVYEEKTSAGKALWYADYADHIHAADKSESQKFFKKILSVDAEPVMLPETETGETGGVSRFYQIPSELFQSVKRYAQNNALTETMVFLGAYGMLLSQYSGKHELMSGIILQNRTHPDTRDMVGMFVNTLPVVFRVKGTLTEYFSAIKEMLLGLFRHQDTPLTEALGAAGISDRTIINTAFVYQGGGNISIPLGGEIFVPRFVETGTSKFDLTMELTPIEDSCCIRMEYDHSKYSGKLIDSMTTGYLLLLEKITKDESARKENIIPCGADVLINDLSVISDDERHRIIEKFNDTHVDYPRNYSVYHFFEKRARENWNKTAVIDCENSYSFAEFRVMVEKIDRKIWSITHGKKQVIGIIADRSVYMLATIWGIIRGGNAYLPISKDFPQDRIEQILAQASCRVVMAQRAFCNLVSDAICIENIIERSDIGSIFVPQANAEDMLYVIFTSGSTGIPKGAMVNNRSAINRILWMEKKYPLKDGIVMLKTPYTFDVSVWEILRWGMFAGCVYILPPEGHYDPSVLLSHIHMGKVTDIHFVPTMFAVFIDYLEKHTDNIKMLRTLRNIFLSGEELKADLINRFSCFTCEAKIHNLYGPTECAVDVSYYDCTGTENDPIPIGRPIDNTEIYILNHVGKEVPIGVTGELYISGENVGMGYLNQPELTAERFVPNPFATEENRHGKIMYRTGDLARWREDGEIEYLGRIDTQVKIRGLRIELGEIESVMASFPGVGLAAAAAQKDENGRQYLVGYYTATENLDEKELRAHLAAKLPKYMVPNYFVRLDEMPMTPSGKTDRKNLPLPDFTAQRNDDYIAPETEMERVLCGIMADVLGAERVGVTDDFFELGGDSLAAITFSAKTHEAGLEIGLQSIFDHPTVRELSKLLTDGEIDGENIGQSPFPEDTDLWGSGYEHYAQLLQADVIDEDFHFEKKPLGNVFLTGATGFLGAHILDALMREETGKIYCLVRSAGGDDRCGRLSGILRWYFGDSYENGIGERIIPVIGNIERPELSDELPEDVQTVIHAAATVKHFGAYDYFHRVNVEGTRHVADYAKRLNARFIHISTISVSGNPMADGQVVRLDQELQFDETCFYIGQPLDNVYIRSKFEAERLVMDEILHGLDAKIVRVGNLTNRARDLKFQPNYESNAFLARMRAILSLRMIPDDLLSLYSEFSPVDLTAEGVVKIAQYAGIQIVFHHYSNKPLWHDRMLPILKRLGVPLKVVRAKQFREAVEQTLREPGREFIYEALARDMDARGRLLYDSNIHIKNDFTMWSMEKIGFAWNEIDEEYLRGYLKYFEELGYWTV